MIIGVPALHFLTWPHRPPARAGKHVRHPVANRTPVVPATPTGMYAIPAYIVQCESGGNWRAVNSTSGAGGAYQILPSTWAAYGGVGLPENASPAQQSAIAEKIWTAVGPSAWSCAR